jgi:TonB family protein
MTKKKDSFYNFIYLSILFHLAIFVFLTVKIMLFPSDIPDYQQSVRIDVVALPEKMKDIEKAPKATAPPPAKEEIEKKVEKKPPVKAEVKKPEVKKEKIFSEKKIKKKTEEEKKEVVEDEQDSAIARLKALQKLKDKSHTQTEEYKGNALSKGNSLTGLEKLHHDSYLDDLETHIRKYWNLPEWLADGNLKASVLLLIDKSGGIISKKLVVKSGNSLFDEHVMSTIEKASPLPPPPAELVNYYMTKGIGIRFPE